MTPRQPRSTLFPYTTLFRSKTFATIAKELKIPLGTALGRMRAAMIKLRARLGDRQAENDKDETSDRKSTRLNSSHVAISYAVFCLKKKKTRSARRSGLRTKC